MGNLLSHRGNTLSFEQENFTRVGKALVGIGTKILQEILETFIQSKDLSFKLTSTTHPDLWRRLNPQQKLLIGQAVTDGYKNFDITLCYTLLRNLNVNAYVLFKPPFPKPTRGWGNQPLATDSTQSDDVERIRILRNEMYGHLARPSIPNTQFADIWGQLREVCTRTKGHNPNGTDFLKEISSLETCIITKIQWNSVVELVQRNREQNKAIEAHTKRLDALEAQQNVLNQDLQIASDTISDIDSKIRIHDIRIDKLDIGNQMHGARIDGQTRQISTMVTEAQTHGTKIDEHGMQIDENTSQLTRLNTAVNRHNIQTAEHARNLTTLDIEVKKQGEQIDGHSTKIVQYDRNISRLDTEVHGLVIQLDDQGTCIEKQRKDLTTLGIRSQCHDAQIDEHALQLATLDNGIQRQEKQIDEFSRELTRVDVGVQKYRSQIKDQSRQLDALSSLYQSQETEIVDIKQNLKFVYCTSAPDKKRNVSILKKRLMQINNDITKAITLSPLQERGTSELPLELLYSQVVIYEDKRYLEKGVHSSGNRKEITDPADIFIKNDEMVRKVYMLGGAAHGKTTYCIWLLKNWCNAKYENVERRSKWETALQEFDFVFLLQFRYVNPCRASVIDMICQDIFGSDKGCSATIRHVLSSDEYRSLIIMDGLDEWSPSKKTRKRLTCQGMPNIEGISSNVSCFFSMRPWAFSTISKTLKVNERVIEMCGLSPNGMENAIRNVLLNHYGLTEDSSKYRDISTRIFKSLKDKRLNSFMQIPLLAVVCVQLWYERKQTEESMTDFYVVMLNMLVERASEKHRLEIGKFESVHCKFPKILSEHENIVNCISVLLKLGKVAYEGIFSNQTNMVFGKRKFENEIGTREMQFALDVGLISQRDAPSLTTKNVKIYFFHRSIQEFLAAVFLVTNEELWQTFCDHLSNVNVIMKFSNAIMFSCGMCPSLGNVILQQIVSVIDKDIDICRYRESLDFNIIVKELYKLQVSCYRELKYGQTDNPVTMYASDIYLDDRDDIEITGVSKELMLDCIRGLRSLWLLRVPTDRMCGISNKDLNDFLSNTHKTRSLIGLCVNGVNTDRTIGTICGSSMRSLQLENVKISNSVDCKNVYPTLLIDMPMLRSLSLWFVTLGDKDLGLSADMNHLEWIRFESVNMSPSGWEKFITSLANVHREVDVKLFYINIDDKSKDVVQSSPDFSVTRDGVGEYGGYEFHFTRVWPLSRVPNNNEK